LSQLAFNLIPERRIYSVSELSVAVQSLLESKFPDVWVRGEISNFRAAASGHFYFTLKDANAQLKAVCFRNQARYLKFKPQDGLSVIARGRLSVYEARGEYQLYVEYLEPEGVGALQLAFEQLKRKLAAEGLFDLARKKPLPLLPHAIGIVTSPDGAAIRDILRVLKRRFPNMNVLIYPAKVQGEEAAAEIVEGIEHFNRHALVDILIVGRGGGSLEDLWPFNEESVARAIAGSKIPVISAVGHETDFTIADFAADLRAPTPSAAAELAVHRREDLLAEVQNRVRHIAQNFRLRLAEAREQLTPLRLHQAFQNFIRRVLERSQRIDDLAAELSRSTREKLEHSRHAWLEASAGIVRYDFARFLGLKQAALESRRARFESEFKRWAAEKQNRLKRLDDLLRERSPLTILGRGYSITRDAAGNIVRDSAQVAVGDEVSLRLARGGLGARVVAKKP
jgi:exodeoxyribonuclease VII large subunit